MLHPSPVIRLKIEDIHEHAKRRPKGYAQDVISSGVVVGEFLELPEESYFALLDRYSGKRVSPALSFVRAVAAWVRGGCKIAPEILRLNRLSVCKRCEWWDAPAFYGLGKCKRCGCSGLKLRMKEEKCPLGKWID
jgi:hypothetical protein